MPETARAAVWDWPVRIVHWALAVLVPWSWWTAEHDMLDRHRLSGIVILGLLVFRLAWGVVGSRTARFAGFVRGPRAVRDYLRGRITVVPGHNPLGGWAIVAMLAALVAQVGLGLFAVDTDGLESGPLSYLVSFDTGRAAARLHHLLFNGLLALIALHIAAILFYLLLRKTDLVTPMLTGSAPVAAPAVEPAVRTDWGRALAAALLAAATAWAFARGWRF